MLQLTFNPGLTLTGFRTTRPRRHVSLQYVVQSNIFWLTILLSYHYRCNDVFTNYRFPVSFLLYIVTKKKLNQIITVNSSTNTPITKKITYKIPQFRQG